MKESDLFNTGVIECEKGSAVFINDNYSFNFYYFMHLHSSNHPLNLYFLLMLIIENCQLRPISQLQFIQNRTQIISDCSLTQI